MGFVVSNNVPISHYQAAKIIEQAANEERIYHYNGGQVYIRLYLGNSALLIIDHTQEEIHASLHDGHDYFKACAGYNESYSARCSQIDFEELLCKPVSGGKAQADYEVAEFELLKSRGQLF